MSYDIDVSRDKEAGVQCAVCDEIHLALESNSFNALMEKVKTAAYEISELNKKLTGGVQLCFKTAQRESIA